MRSREPPRSATEDGPVRAWCNDHDRHPALTWLAATGLAAGLALATFGLPPVDLHSPLHHLGVMDPLCGMTRGVRLTLRGNYAAAVRYNPAAPFVPSAALLVLVRAGLGHLTHRWLDLSIRWTPTLVATALLVMAVLWARQQANATLLTEGRP